MGADAEADEGLLAQAKDNDKISGYLGRWKAYMPLSTDGSFTFYPFQAGTPYYFEKLPGTGGKEEHAVQEVKPIQDDCLECESKDCAYNRDGICRFSKVFDRGPSITVEDGCTEFVIRHTY